MPNFLYEDLTQRLSRVLEPRYQTLFFENGDLIPTLTDLEPGNKEIAYDQIGEFGDADLVGDGTTNIPIVDISIDRNRYPIFMVASGFPITFQEERAYNATHYHLPDLDRFQRRMAAARKAIAMRINRYTAFGIPGAYNAPGFLTNPDVPTDNNSFNLYGCTYQQALDFFVYTIESISDNFVSMAPTDMLLPKEPYKKIMSLQNGALSDPLKVVLERMYPNLTITKVQELEAMRIDVAMTTPISAIPGSPQSGQAAIGNNNPLYNVTQAAAGQPASMIPGNATNPPFLPAGMMMRPGVGKDRIMIYPKDPEVQHRHIEQSIAELLPEEYIRTDGLRRIYTLFSCITPAIFDYPQDARYIDIPPREAARAGGVGLNPVTVTTLPQG